MVGAGEVEDNVGLFFRVPRAYRGSSSLNHLEELRLEVDWALLEYLVAPCLSRPTVLAWHLSSGMCKPWPTSCCREFGQTRTLHLQTRRLEGVQRSFPDRNPKPEPAVGTTCRQRMADGTLHVPSSPLSPRRSCSALHGRYQPV